MFDLKRCGARESPSEARSPLRRGALRLPSRSASRSRRWRRRSGRRLAPAPLRSDPYRRGPLLAPTETRRSAGSSRRAGARRARRPRAGELRLVSFSSASATIVARRRAVRRAPRGGQAQSRRSRARGLDLAPHGGVRHRPRLRLRAGSLRADRELAMTHLLDERMHVALPPITARRPATIRWRARRRPLALRQR